MFDTVVISGGGSKGYLALGALDYAIQNEMAKNITTYVGCSIGSAICLLLVCGYKPKEILHQLSSIDLFHAAESNVIDIATKYGLIDIESFAYKYRHLVRKKFDIEPTLKELYDATGINLIIPAVNVSTQEMEYFNHISRPNMLCVDAVKCSCAVPFVFHRVEYEGNFYADGGLVDNFPIKYVDNGTRKVLGIRTSFKAARPDTNILSYIYKLIFIPINELQDVKSMDLSMNCYVVNVKDTDTSFIDLHNTYEVNLKMFTDGYKCFRDQVVAEPIPISILYEIPDVDDDNWGWE